MPSSHNTPPSENPPEAREELTGLIHINPSLLEETRQSVRNLEQLREKLQQLQQPTGITPFFHTLLVAAISLDTSDIHVEPEEGKAQLRLRIDGMLHDLMEIPFPLYENLLSRIKLVSEVKLNVADKPQDGRFSFELTQGELIEVRTATLPAEYGESLVLRVLNPRSLITIEELGLKGSMLQLLKQELFKPNGMIIATGPTGSGKTTTLYAFLKEIVKPEIKIVTIEDPIEYHLEGISQTQVNPEKGYDFASGLEAIVRQDPDIILVGEIRDKETAQIAIQAALTGHLVLSTLHTNDAPGTVSRLISLGAQAVNIGTASNVILGQRLVRKVCPHCSVLTAPTEQELEKIKKALPSRDISSLQISKVKGCAQCNNAGYKGRIGIFEVILIDPAMEEFILTNPSTAALRKFAIKQGMVTMHQDGILKVLEGITTIDEVERVTGNI